MKHRIVVLGAGYAGAYSAGNLARRLSRKDAEITVINALPEFVQRQRLNQLAAGRDIEAPKLTDVFAGTGIRLLVARVTALDPERRVVTVAGAASATGAASGASATSAASAAGAVSATGAASAAGDTGDTDDSDPNDHEVGYDTLLYALGSQVADQSVPGVTEHGFDVAGRASALRLRTHLDSLHRRGHGGRVLVVGDGFTGIETATEVAESLPNLSVALLARGELGARLSLHARRHLRRACDRLGITVLEHTSVEAVESNRVRCAGGTLLASDATVWTAGFAVSPIAAAGGLEVTDTGQIVVDRVMRSVSHPSIYAVGDSVHILGDNGRPLPMNCGSAGFTGRQAFEAIIGQLTGRKIPTIKLVHQYNAISLGRRDGILHLIDDAARPKPKHLGGRSAVRIKAGIQWAALWSTSHPTFGLPRRGRRLIFRDIGEAAAPPR